MIKLVIFSLIVISILGGIGAGYLLKPESPEEDLVIQEIPSEKKGEDLQASSIISLKDQFTVPVLREGQIWSHIVLSLGLETASISRENVLLMEPVLRDGLNESLFRHASLGGFEGNFTSALKMNELRLRLNNTITYLLEDPEARVLIISITRQSG